MLKKYSPKKMAFISALTRTLFPISSSTKNDVPQNVNVSFRNVISIYIAERNYGSRISLTFENYINDCFKNRNVEL